MGCISSLDCFCFDDIETVAVLIEVSFISSFRTVIGNAAAAAAVCPVVPLHGRYPTHRRQYRDPRRPADHRHYRYS